MERGLFTHNEKEIQKLRGLESKLNAFLGRLQAESFDDDDRNVITDAIQRVSAKRAKLEEVLRQKKEIYDTKIRALEKKVDERMTMLKKVDEQIFRQFPKILKHFTKKQSRMQSVLKSIKASLQKG